jgi:UDP-N-acetyl-D-glucosamine dehydrogenase
MHQDPPATQPALDALLARFAARDATVGVVGLGYVGLPLVRAMVHAGFRVVGYDIDPAKIEMLRRGETYLKHLGAALAKDLAATGRFTPTDQPEQLASCDAICLCVPTPLGAHKDPDLRYVERSTRMVAEQVARARHARRADSPHPPPVLVSLESTTYPGTTRELCLPILEAAGLTLGSDFVLCFSPEREDPGREGVETRAIPRLVGGVDDASTRAGVALYAAAIERVIPVASAEVAEAAKLLENIYRAVNIALVNELKPVLTSMGIDIWQVIDAAATKPFGFQRFNPGPGLGGHCIPIDPYYLTWRAQEYGHATRFIELAGEVNSAMPRYVVERVGEALNQQGRAVKGSGVLVLGIAYKPDVDDIRETPAAEIVEMLGERGARVSYHDPHVPVFPRMRRYQIELASVEISERALREADCVVVVTDHKAIDWTLVGEHARLIVDTRNAMARARGTVRARVVKA